MIVPTVSMTKAPSARKGEEANERVSIAQQEAAAAAVGHLTSAADVQVRYVGQGPATWFELKYKLKYFLNFGLDLSLASLSPRTSL